MANTSSEDNFDLRDGDDHEFMRLTRCLIYSMMNYEFFPNSTCEKSYSWFAKAVSAPKHLFPPAKRKLADLYPEATGPMMSKGSGARSLPSS